MILQRLSLVTGRHTRRVLRSLPAAMSTIRSDGSDSSASHNFFAAVLAGVALTAVTASCEQSRFTPTQVATEAFPTGEKNPDEMEQYPVYTSDQVAENDGTDGKPIWMSYGGVVYDVTNFIANHPGGSEKVICCFYQSSEHLGSPLVDMLRGF